MFFSVLKESTFRAYLEFKGTLKNGIKTTGFYSMKSTLKNINYCTPAHMRYSYT
jgi:hypothetical protein